MKRDQPSFRQFWDGFFSRFRKLPAPDVDPAWERVLDRLREDRDGLSVERANSVIQPLAVHRRRSPWVMAVVAASLLAVVGVVAFRNSPSRTDPFVAVAEDREKIRIGEPVQSPAGRELTLTDGSRLNMRPNSELSFYRAADDLCVQLVRGDLVVNVVKQEAGRHLCVQTKDFIVTVVGTVFTVGVEEKGSRVVVEEGTVWVQQGSTRKTLVAGEKFSTIVAEPEAIPPALASTAAPPSRPPARQAPPQARETAKPSAQSFETISIKMTPPSEIRPEPYGRRVAQGGVRAANVTLKDLVLMAYDMQVFQVSGGPAWVNNDRFNIETRIGSNVVRFPTMGDSLDVWTEWQQNVLLMMQDMLATRFKLKVRRTTEQSAAYALVLAGKTSKLQSVTELRPGSRGGGRYDNAARMADLAQFLSSSTGQPVVDRTGLPGLYDIKLTFLPEAAAEQLASRGDNPGEIGVRGDGRGGRGGRGVGRGVEELQDLRSALQDQLGLKLETTKAPVEFLVIESAEKPSEN